MKLELTRSEVIPKAWVLVVDLNKKPVWLNLGVEDWRSEFTDLMDRNFVLPFDCRRIGAWLRYPGRIRTYWTHVTLPEQK
jgi:hypothetical protein